MKKRTLITLISEQTLPNVLFIRQMPKYDRHIFISTASMEKAGRSDAIARVCNICPEKYLVDPDNITSILGSLGDIRVDQDESVTLHMTGGTKLMSLACYGYFLRGHEDVAVYYLSINGPTIMQIYPESHFIELEARLDLREYLFAHGVRIIGESKLPETKGTFLKADRLLQQIRMGGVPKEITDAADPNVRKPDKNFFLGGWLELWLAWKIRDLLGLDDKEISFNLKLTRTMGGVLEYTEYDVMYVRDNRLYVAECKYFSSQKFEKSRINKDWYKLAGLQLQMGLFARPFLVTANKIGGSLKEYLEESHQLFRIQGYADIDIIGNDERFVRFLDGL